MRIDLVFIDCLKIFGGEDIPETLVLLDHIQVTLSYEITKDSASIFYDKSWTTDLSRGNTCRETKIHSPRWLGFSGESIMLTRSDSRSFPVTQILPIHLA